MPRFTKQFDNNMRGVLFENDRKTTDAHPDMKGKLEIDGQVYWVSAWWNQHAQRGEYLKFNIEAKECDDRSPQQRNNDYQQERQPQRGTGSQRSGGQGQGAPQYGRGGNGQQPRGGRGQYQPQSGNDEMDDDIPF